MHRRTHSEATAMTKLVTIYGGSGFVGRYIARRMARDGWRVRVAVRRPNEAIFVRPYGVVGQVEPVFCNIRDDESVRLVMKGADAVVNCVGTFDKGGRNSFEAVQDKGASRIARIAAEEGVGALVHISAIGADAGSDSLYARSKAAGEAGVLAHFPRAVILRPSVVFGAEDQFFNRFAGMTRLGPVLPVIGGRTRFQPVHVDDVAKAAALGVLGKATPGVYELGGPDVATFRDLMVRMLGIIRRRRLVMDVPLWLGRIMGVAFDALHAVTLGLVKGPVTLDQVRSLARDNVVTGRTGTFADLGIQPASMEAVLPEYLWRFRPTGQYEVMTESAKRLRS
jgi:NADH dehydrogenase